CTCAATSGPTTSAQRATTPCTARSSSQPCSPTRRSSAAPTDCGSRSSPPGPLQPAPGDRLNRRPRLGPPVEPLVRRPPDLLAALARATSARATSTPSGFHVKPLGAEPPDRASWPVATLSGSGGDAGLRAGPSGWSSAGWFEPSVIASPPPQRSRPGNGPIGSTHAADP